MKSKEIKIKFNNMLKRLFQTMVSIKNYKCMSTKYPYGCFVNNSWTQLLWVTFHSSQKKVCAFSLLVLIIYNKFKEIKIYQCISDGSASTEFQIQNFLILKKCNYLFIDIKH